MDDLNSRIPFGYVQKSRGLKGELLVALRSTDITIEKGIRVVWLGDDPNQANPWRVEYLRPHGAVAFLKLKDVKSREEADFLKGISVFIATRDIVNNASVKLLGYSVISENDHHLVGEIIDLDSTELQQRLIIKSGDKIVEIPVVAEFIKAIDHEKRTVSVFLIDGLEG